MTFQEKLKDFTVNAFAAAFQANISPKDVTVNITKKDHEGNYTIVIFPLSKSSKKSPQETAQILGNYFLEINGLVKKFNVVNGFLNLTLSDTFLIQNLRFIEGNSQFGILPANNKKVVLEYCGPNTNKPLHIGHVRNMLLGFSMSEILSANGYHVTKVNIYNDRGIAICKSMVAYSHYGHGSTPSSAQVKGDRFVGDWYVKFNEESNKERKEFNQNIQAALYSVVGGEESGRSQILDSVPALKGIIYILDGKAELTESTGQSKETKMDLKNFKENPDAFLRLKLNSLRQIYNLIANDENSSVIKCKECIKEIEKIIDEFLEKSLFSEAVSTVKKWEADDPETIKLWKQMNAWVYAGFKETYQLLGVDFQKDYYESETYKLGKNIIEEGLEKKVFYKRKDGAVAVDLTPEGLDEKVLLRSDGTSIYITQDLGTAQLRYEEFKMDRMIYVVANEQDYHFKVLKLALQKLGKQWADGIFHLSYALVESPTGRFKSREGKTADADDLIAEVLRIAEEKTKELGKIEDFTEQQAQELYRTIGLGALKYFVLRVNPYKKIIFNPEESIDFHGHTGPFIQYTHARICAVVRKAALKSDGNNVDAATRLSLEAVEREIIIQLSEYENTVRSACEKMDPSEIANYVYSLAKTYNKFYHDLPILTAESEDVRNFRLSLSQQTGVIIKKSMKLLGIDVPEKM
jgi:arginyl-tRNA synthetase